MALTRPNWLKMVLSSFSHKITTFFVEILNLKGHLNCNSGSKVTAILLNWWPLPIGGTSEVKGVCLQPNK